MRINEEGYLERCSREYKYGKKYRDWWLIKATMNGKKTEGTITIRLPEKYIGKKVKIKIERAV